MKLVLGLILSACLGGTVAVQEPNIFSSRDTPALYFPVAVIYSDTIENPEIFEGFMNAIVMWQEKVNIHIKIYTVLTQEEWDTFPGAKLDIRDEWDPNLMGYWDGRINLLVLDTDMANISVVEMDINMESVSTLVAVHELGHAFGLPHITYVLDDNGLPTYPRSSPGDIVFETEEEAQNYVMFPVVHHNRATGISDLEADLVTRAMNLPR